MHQNGEWMKESPYGEPTNIGRHGKIFGGPGDLVAGFCAPGVHRISYA